MSETRKIKVGDVVREIESGNWDGAKVLVETAQELGINVCRDIYLKQSVAEKLLSDLSKLEIAVAKEIAEISPRVFVAAACHGVAAINFCLKNLVLRGEKLPPVPNEGAMRHFGRNMYFEAAENAATHNQIGVLEYLKELGVYVNMSPCMSALRQDNLPLLLWLEKNYPDRIYYCFDYHLAGNSFECDKYFYSKGYTPCYESYKTALANDDGVYVEWLQSIECPGTFEDDCIPDIKIVIEKFDSELTPTDFPWLLKLAQEKNFPPINLDSKKETSRETSTHFTEPRGYTCYLVRRMDELVEYEPFWENEDVTKYIFTYISKLKIPVGSILRWLESNTKEKSVLMISCLDLDKYMRAEIYSLYDCIVWDEDRTNIFTQEELETLLNPDYGFLFLVDLNHWIEQEGSFQAVEFRDRVDILIEKYKSKIPQLQDPINIARWTQLKESDSYKDEVSDFLHELGMWN